MENIVSLQSVFQVIASLRTGLIVGVLVLTACGGRYQAPMDDQSAVLERTPPPPIYSTTGPSAVGGVSASAPISSGSVASAPAARTSSASTVGAGVRVEPAAGVSVNVVNESNGIRRGAIGRAPIDGATPTPNPSPSPSRSQIPEVSIPAPSSTSAPTATPGGQTYTVARGDTLYSIAWQYSLDYRALALANNLLPPYTIFPNQQLSLNIGGVSNNARDQVPAIPAAPAGDPIVMPGERPAASIANRRTGSVQTRQVESIDWQWPVDGRVLSGFNAATSGTSRGIDIGGRRGDPVYAAADGDVVYSGRGIQGQGDLIIIRHSARHLSAYSHNSNMLVSEGATIRAGDKIAEVGTDARGTELLHFEVRVDGKPVDPSIYLPPR